MPIIEVDMLIALVNSSDNLHNVADSIFLKIKEKRIKNISVATSAYNTLARKPPTSVVGMNRQKSLFESRVHK
jgi:hypothetical protein